MDEGTQRLAQPAGKGILRASSNVKSRERLRWVALAGVGVLLLLAAVLAQTGYLNRLVYQPVDMEGYWVTISAGEFQIGNENGDDDEKPVHTVYLEAYQIGKYEITNNQYNRCLRAAVCTGSVVPDKLDHPVANVNWHAAKTYCEWAGGRLPTEAEWEKAASWDPETKTKFVYPWGNSDPTSALLNYNSDVGDTTPVGTYPDGVSPYGLFDMAGNVWEWVNDWYGEAYYQSSPSSNPLGPDTGQYRVLRGGSWGGNDKFVRSDVRQWYIPTNTNDLTGFRCTRSLP